MIKFAAQIITWMFGCLPRRWCLGFGRWVGWIMFYVIRERAQVAMDNLKLIYKETLSPSDRMRLARKNFAHLGGTLFETIHVAARPKSLRRIIQIEGTEHLQAAIAQHKRAILFTGHFGAFHLLGAPMREYCDIQYIYRAPTQPGVNQAYLWLGQRLNLSFIADNPRHECAIKAFTHLRSGGVIGFLIDQVETGGVYVDFMGEPAGSTTGAVNLALRSRAPLLPARILRLPDSTHRITIFPEFVIERRGEPQLIVERAVAGMNQLLGEWVRAEPTQWFWPHRRWRKWRK